MARLLFDENLSPRLPGRLASSYPGSRHVYELDLGSALDAEIWARAAADGFVVVTKDDDFRQLSFLRGAPPKVIWLVVGNARTDVIARLLESQQAEVARFLSDPEEALLLLRLPPRESA